MAEFFTQSFRVQLSLSRKLENIMTKTASSKTKHDVVQVRNPRTGHYVKIDRTAGKIIAHKQSEGPYQNIPVARKRK